MDFELLTVDFKDINEPIQLDLYRICKPVIPQICTPSTGEILDVGKYVRDDFKGEIEIGQLSQY